MLSVLGSETIGEFWWAASAGKEDVSSLMCGTVSSGELTGAVCGPSTRGVGWLDRSPSQGSAAITSGVTFTNRLLSISLLLGRSLVDTSFTYDRSRY